MLFKHIESDSSGLLKKSIIYSGQDCIEININCLEKYSHDHIVSPQNNIARLFESYRRSEITPDEFSTRYLSLKEKMISTFLSKLKYSDQEFALYCFKSNDKMIGLVLEELRFSVTNYFFNSGIPFTDISECLIKQDWALPGSKQDFDAVLKNYLFSDKLFFDDRGNYSKISRLVIIDDVISRGKSLYALLSNLYQFNIITSSTIIYGNFLYCIEKRYEELFAPDDN